MNKEPVNGALARRFLLGDVEDEERERIEALFLSEQETKNRILIAEEDLIEGYLENSLAASDREKFLTQYGQTPRQKRKLRIAKSITEYAAREYDAGRAAPATTEPAIPGWRTFLSALGPGNLKVFIPVAATLTIALITAFVWLLDLNNRGAQRNNQRLAIERELAALNTPSKSLESPTQVSSIVLAPLMVRSAQPQSELTPRADIQVVELQLLWMQKEQYGSYRAVLRRAGGAEEFAISDLHVERKNGSNMIRVLLPFKILTRGAYQISLHGVAASGALEPPEEYNFMVGG